MLSVSITVTSIFLLPTASICDTRYEDCIPTRTTTPNPNPNLSPSPSRQTWYYAPVVISAPASCAEITSLLYTTFHEVGLNIADYPYTDLLPQATDSSEAVFITTSMVTGMNLDWQAVTTPICNVYLKDGAVLGLQPSDDEADYLYQCMDPRRYICTTTTESLGSCQITGGAYPPGPDGQTASPTSEGRVGGIGNLVSQALLLLTLSMSVQVSSMVF